MRTQRIVGGHVELILIFGISLVNIISGLSFLKFKYFLR